MKVLQINSVCGIGSTGRIATDIHNILVELGYESYIAYGRDLPKNCDTSVKIGTKYDNYLHGTLTKIFDRHGYGSIKATYDFIKYVEKLDPDVIHLHNIHGYYINIKILFEYLKKVNKHVIWTLHDCWSFTGHCVYFDYIGCNKWKTKCFNCPQKNSYPSSLFLDNSKNNYYSKKEIFSGVNNMTIVTPSKWLAELVKESFLGDYPVKVINNGIDINLFTPTDSDFRRKFNLGNKFIILGVASGWGKRKGIEYFIELSNQLNSDEALVMVGFTKKQKKNLPEKIIGITRTNNVKELVEIYSAVDVFINPTLEDNFPTTNIEALACGTPVITFNTGGSVESIGEGCGYIVEKGDINQIIKKIQIIRNGDRLALSNKTIERAKLLYNKTDRFGEYISLYESYLQNKLE